MAKPALIKNNTQEIVEFLHKEIYSAVYNPDGFRKDFFAQWKFSSFCFHTIRINPKALKVILQKGPEALEFMLQKGFFDKYLNIESAKSGRTALVQRFTKTLAYI